MKRVYLALIAACAVACGGGGSGGPVTLPNDDGNNPPPFTVASGSFNLTATPSFNGCERTTDWTGTYNVAIDGTSFALGNWQGSWNASTVTGVAESEKDKTTTRSCTTTDWTEARITFTSEDVFSGTFTFRHRLAGSCPNLVTCTSTWTVTGTRTGD